LFNASNERFKFGSIFPGNALFSMPLFRVFHFFEQNSRLMLHCGLTPLPLALDLRGNCSSRPQRHSFFVQSLWSSIKKTGVDAQSNIWRTRLQLRGTWCCPFNPKRSFLQHALAGRPTNEKCQQNAVFVSERILFRKSVQYTHAHVKISEFSAQSQHQSAVVMQVK